MTQVNFTNNIILCQSRQFNWKIVLDYFILIIFTVCAFRSSLKNRWILMSNSSKNSTLIIFFFKEWILFCKKEFRPLFTRISNGFKTTPIKNIFNLWIKMINGRRFIHKMKKIYHYRRIVLNKNLFDMLI
jgi:hypothetical protein